jgi:hypothetical protein
MFVYSGNPASSRQAEKTLTRHDNKKARPALLPNKEETGRSDSFILFLAPETTGKIR